MNVENIIKCTHGEQENPVSSVTFERSPIPSELFFPIYLILLSRWGLRRWLIWSGD